jgi:hypothetical protein
VVEAFDAVALYGQALGWTLRHRTILVEGTTDVDLFTLAARLELQATGFDLLGSDLAVIAAGERDRGGTQGVIRELVSLRGFSRTLLARNGRPIYRFIGFFDNDKAGQQAVKAARSLDTSIIEFKDVFRIHPVMPTTGNLDPSTLQKAFERENNSYKGLFWELEDLLPDHFFKALRDDYPNAITKTMQISDRVHWDLSRDGKARLHRLVKQYATRQDLNAVVDLLKAFRFYFSLPNLASPHTEDT